MAKKIKNYHYYVVVDFVTSTTVNKEHFEISFITDTEAELYNKLSKSINACVQERVQTKNYHNGWSLSILTKLN